MSEELKLVDDEMKVFEGEGNIIPTILIPSELMKAFALRFCKRARRDLLEEVEKIIADFLMLPGAVMTIMYKNEFVVESFDRPQDSVFVKNAFWV